MARQPKSRTKEEAPAATLHFPPERSSFVGRDEAIDALGKLCQEHQLVTLVGPPGTGKTRLSREVVRRLADRERALEGWFCDLTPARSAVDCCAAVATTLDIDISGVRTADGIVELVLARLQEVTRDETPAVLILDNAEHVREAVADLAARCLAASGLRLIVTSREALELDSERLFEVRGLSPREGLNLIVDRARRFDPLFELVGGDEDALLQVVERLDGLPLALEIASSRLVIQTPEELRDRLFAQFDLLETTRPASGELQETLHKSVASSWELLSAGERSALVRCALFRGPFRVADAQALIELGGDDNALDAIQQLVRRSLAQRVDVAQERRAWLQLPLSVREFARAHADVADLSQARRAFARLWINAYERWREADYSPAHDTWVRRVRIDLPNLLEAHELNVENAPALAFDALAPVEMLTSVYPLDELSRWADMLEETATSIDDARRRARVHHLRAIIDFSAGTVAEAVEHIDRELELLPEDDRLARASAHNVRGISLDLGGKLQEARASFERAIEELERLDYPAQLGITLGNLGGVLLALGDIASAKRYLERAEVLLSQHAARTHLLHILGILAIVSYHRSDFDRVRRITGEAIAYYEKTGDMIRGFPAKVLRAQVCLDERDVDASEAIVSDARALAERFGSPIFECPLLALDGQRALEAADFEEAEAKLVRERALAEELGYGYGVVQALYLLGLTRLCAGRDDDARKTLEEAFALAESADEWLMSRKILGLLIVLDALDARAPRVEPARVRRELEQRGFLLETALLEVIALSEELRPAVQAVRDREPARLLRAVRTLGERLDALEDLQGFEARQIRRCLQRRLDALGERIPEAGLIPGKDPERVLVVGIDFRWFRVDDEHVDLSRRSAHIGILRALVESRRSQPVRALGVDDVIAAGWPGEVLTPESGATRVYTAVRQFRTMGLRGILVMNDEGYLLDEDVTIRLEEAP